MLIKRNAKDFDILFILKYRQKIALAESRKTKKFENF